MQPQHQGLPAAPAGPREALHPLPAGVRGHARRPRVRPLHLRVQRRPRRLLPPLRPPPPGPARLHGLRLRRRLLGQVRLLPVRGVHPMNRNQVVYSTGALHWLTHACMYLLVLDLRDLAWRKMSMPEEIAAAGGFAGRVYLLDFEGSVSVVRIYREWMSVWVLEDYRRELWVLKDRVNLRCIRGFATSAFPVSQSKDVVFLATQKKVLTYGRKDKVWREVILWGMVVRIRCGSPRILSRIRSSLAIKVISCLTNIQNLSFHVKSIIFLNTAEWSEVK
ncbi:F-box protein-like [Iris pallida]|uniref:F-box protein-like n=1 Tax=Iris pallida TaxID=29817 RepID=A0AAX6DWV0_IRIPA|nr:F-box protein-like [Iris pallida]